MARPEPKIEVTIRMARELKERAQAEGLKRGMSMSEYIRRALEATLDEDEDRRARNR